MASTKPLWLQPKTAIEGKVRSLMGRSWGELSRERRSHEVLISVDNNGLWERAAVLESEEAFNEVYGDYRAGRLLSIYFYALPKTVLSEPGVETS